MTFLNPQFFWALIVPFVVFAFLITTNKSRLSRIFDEKVLQRLLATNESMPMVVRNILLLLAIFLMIVAMARPVKQQGDKTVEVKGLSVLVGLDISGSMRSEDVYPNRLTFAKKKMNRLFDAMPSDEIGVMAFAYSSFVLAPFSSDKQTLKMMVEGVDDSYINMGSTDFGALGELSASLLEDKEPKVLILFSDGGDKEAIEGFANILKESGIELYVVLIGSDKGAPVLTKEGKPFMQADGTIAITQRNDALGEVAQSSGGAFVIASHGKEDIEQLVSVIHDKHQNQAQAQVKVKQNIEYFYYPLGFGVLLLLIGFSALPQRRKV